MNLLNPHRFQSRHTDQPTAELMQAVIDWFEARGLKQLKTDWHDRTWNYDFVAFMKEKQLLATLMTPAGYGECAHWDSLRNVQFAEIVAFYGIAYWYTFQVSMLGLGPIFNGDNEAAKQRAARLLSEGGVFAFGLSEKEHGADIYSSDMELVPQPDGTYLARGDKYYIGNGNEAALVSVFARNAETGEYVFFIVDSKHPNYSCVKNTVAHQCYVSEFTLNDYPITEDDILSTGQKAWDDMLNTINYCKFNLGFGAIGLTSHALYEAIDHAANRNLYGRYVTDFPQVRRLLTDSYCRLIAMKLFSYRATDYMRCASGDDRRYLLYNPLVKMKVTMQGERAVADIFDVIAARGFEKEPFFEVAAREIGMLPKLEGTAHVNMGLVVKFMRNYMFNPAEFEPVPRRDDLADDTFLFQQGPTRGLGDVRFHDYRMAYDLFDLPNIEVFKGQVATFRAMLEKAGPDESQVRDIDYMLGLGELFTLVVYGQLILEHAAMENTDLDLLNQIFGVFVRDFSTYAAELHGKPGNTAEQRTFALSLIQAPIANPDQFDKVWQEHVYALKGQYQLRP